MFAPRSSITTSPRADGVRAAKAGRSTPGKVLITILANAKRAPVLPADTTPPASPFATESIASRMEASLSRSAAVGFISAADHRLGAWRSVTGLRSRRVRSAISGRTRASSPNSRKRALQGAALRPSLTPRRGRCRGALGRRPSRRPRAEKASLTRGHSENLDRNGAAGQSNQALHGPLERPCPPPRPHARRNSPQWAADVMRAASARRSSGTRQAPRSTRRVVRSGACPGREGEVFFFGTAMGQRLSGKAVRSIRRTAWRISWITTGQGWQRGGRAHYQTARPTAARDVTPEVTLTAAGAAPTSAVERVQVSPALPRPKIRQAGPARIGIERQRELLNRRFAELHRLPRPDTEINSSGSIRVVARPLRCPFRHEMHRTKASDDRLTRMRSSVDDAQACVTLRLERPGGLDARRYQAATVRTARFQLHCRACTARQQQPCRRHRRQLRLVSPRRSRSRARPARSGRHRQPRTNSSSRAHADANSSEAPLRTRPARPARLRRGSACPSCQLPRC